MLIALKNAKVFSFTGEPAAAGVQSVTGTRVDNTNPANPVVISPAFFSVTSLQASQAISSDPDNPSYLLGLVVDKASGIALADAATGAMVNNTGRTLSMVAGTISFNPDAAGTPTLNIVSEYSDNGLAGPWIGNLDSRRTIEITNNTESFSTNLSRGVGWTPGRWVRFRFWVSSGTVSLVTNTVTALGGQQFKTPAVAWELKEA